MLESCKTAQERWGGVHDLIDRWLSERKDLLVKFCSIDGLDEFQSKPITISEKVQGFCEILVDYVSAGHFEIYEQLIREAQEFGDKAALDTYQRLYPSIAANTQIALDFNDKYLTIEQIKANEGSLSLDLSSIGEALESRFGWEDELIEKLHEAHREKLA